MTFPSTLHSRDFFWSGKFWILVSQATLLYCSNVAEILECEPSRDTLLRAVSRTFLKFLLPAFDVSISIHQIRCPLSQCRFLSVGKKLVKVNMIFSQQRNLLWLTVWLNFWLTSRQTDRLSVCRTDWPPNCQIRQPDCLTARLSLPYWVIAPQLLTSCLCDWCSDHLVITWACPSSCMIAASVLVFHMLLSNGSAERGFLAPSWLTSDRPTL